MTDQNSEFEIRRMALADVDGLREVADTVFRERKFFIRTESVDTESLREFVSKNITAGSIHSVATRESRVVGWCDVLRDTLEPSRHVGRLGIGLLPECRGRGLGKRLIEFTLGEAERAGFGRVELEVFPSNDRAVRLYESVGFVREGMKRHAVRLDGRWEHLLLMAYFPGHRTQGIHDENTIDYIEIPATNLSSTKAFFSGLFGWKFEDFGPKHCSFADGRISGGFFESPNVVSTQSGSPLIVFYRTDLEGALKAVEDAGGKIIKPIFSFPGGRRFHFTDPSGNEYAIWSER